MSQQTSKSTKPSIARKAVENADAPAKDLGVTSPSTQNASGVDAAFKGHHWPFDHGRFAPLNSLRREVDDLFNQFSNRFGLFSQDASDRLQIPALDVNETESALEISAELPGVAQEDIDVSLADGVLTIHGEKQQSSESEDAQHRISECSYGVYERSLTLPFYCDAEDISAQYDNGVLRLSVSKPTKGKGQPQKVTVKSAA